MSETLVRATRASVSRPVQPNVIWKKRVSLLSIEV